MFYLYLSFKIIAYLEFHQHYHNRSKIFICIGCSENLQYAIIKIEIKKIEIRLRHVSCATQILGTR